MNRYLSRRVGAGVGAVGLAVVGTAVALAVTSGSAASASTDVASPGLTSTGVASTNVASTATPAARAAADERCERALPADVVGDPHVVAGAASGLRVWHDTTGWHLRATHPGSAAVVFTGTVRSGQPITVHRYRLEAHDQIGFSRDRRTMTFRFVNHGAVDGIDFTDRCADHTSFAFGRAGHWLAAGDVWLGAQGAHPASDPFTEVRTGHERH